ncbi:MAG: HIT-like protein [Synergistetes bacterium ADurb.Bin520]|nr:MAG: HIT-like protein [Synergistetes bacterium ADurb.Bin520]
MARCLFCDIVERHGADFVFQDDAVVAFRDIHPQAPGHILIVPRVHVPSAAALDDPGLWGRVMSAAVKVAREEGFAERGYRLVVNCGEQACQTIPHLHVHLLGGRSFRWPPG